MRVKFTLHAHEVLSGLSTETGDSIRSAIRSIGKNPEEFFYIYESLGNESIPATAIEAAGDGFYFVYQPGTNPLYVTRVGVISELSLALRAQLCVHQNANMFDGPYEAQLDQQVIVAKSLSFKNTMNSSQRAESFKPPARVYNPKTQLYRRIQQTVVIQQAEKFDPEVIRARIQRILLTIGERRHGSTIEGLQENFDDRFRLKGIKTFL